MSDGIASGSPAAAATALVQSGIFATYMLYERSGIWTVAGGVRASVTLDAEQIIVRHSGGETRRRWRTKPLISLGEELNRLPISRWNAYGWLTFEAAHAVAGRRDLAGTSELAHLIVPRIEVHIGRTGVRIQGADRTMESRVRAVLAEMTLPEPVPTMPVPLANDRDWYRHAVAAAVGEIRKDSFHKVVLSRKVPVAAEIDFPRTYLAGRMANNPARSFLLDMGGRRATGFCPEMILEADPNGLISTQPLAGTRSLGNGSPHDRRLRAQLTSDPKEIYEHAISVKESFEELRRVCVPASVAVSDLMSVKERGGVQHLGSRVRGRLAPGRSAWDALESVFPAVTCTGIPKSAACEYIAHTENSPRGLYAGGVLMAGHDGRLDVGLVLRTLFEQDGHRWLRAGAGIVGASRPDREYEETCEKLRSVATHLVEKQAPGSPVPVTAVVEGSLL